MRSSLCLLLLAACVATPRASTPDRVERARRAEARSDWLEAGELYQAAYEDSGHTDVTAARGLARTLVAQGEVAGATRVLSGVEAPDAPLLLELGDYRLRLGARGGAEEAWTRAAELDPSSLEARRRLAELRLAEHRPAAALTVLREAVALAPRDPGLWADLAGAALAAGEPREAQQAYLTLAALVPLDLDQALGVARLVQAAGELERLGDVAGWLARALETDPSHAEGWRLLADLRAALEDEAGHLAALRSALEADPGDRQVLVRLGQARATRGEWDRVEALARHAQRLGQDDMVAHFEALLVLRPEEEPDEKPDEKPEKQRDGSPDPQPSEDGGEDGATPRP